MDDERFEQLVSEALDTIPERFMKRIDNVAILTADHPSDEQLKENHIPPGSTLLGLYEGIPLTERGDLYGIGQILPDKITIFKEPVLAEAREIDRVGWDVLPKEGTIKRVVRDTVWHEIAHYFGYDDTEIEEREGKGTNFSE